MCAGVLGDQRLQLALALDLGDVPLGGEAVEPDAGFGRDRDAALPGGEAREGVDEVYGGVVVVRAAAVSGRADGCQPQPADVLLVGGDGEDVGLFAEQLGGAGAALESSNSTSTRSGRFLQSQSMPQTEPASSSGTPQKTRSRLSGTPSRLSSSMVSRCMMPQPFISTAPRPVDLAVLDYALEGGLGQ